MQPGTVCLPALAWGGSAAQLIKIACASSGCSCMQLVMKAVQVEAADAEMQQVAVYEKAVAALYCASQAADIAA